MSLREDRHPSGFLIVLGLGRRIRNKEKRLLIRNQGDQKDLGGGANEMSEQWTIEARVVTGVHSSLNGRNRQRSPHQARGGGV